MKPDYFGQAALSQLSIFRRVGAREINDLQAAAASKSKTKVTVPVSRRV
jgi:hypothetical protein